MDTGQFDKAEGPKLKDLKADAIRDFDDRIVAFENAEVALRQLDVPLVPFDKFVAPIDMANAFFGVTFDLEGANNLDERLTIIGEATQPNAIHAIDVAAYLIASGNSKSSIRKIRPTIHNALRSRTDFSFTGEGNFVYSPQPVADPSDDDSEGT